MTSLPAHRHFLQPKKNNLDVGFPSVVGDENEPGFFLIFLIFFSSVAKDKDELRSSLVVILGCFSLVTKDDDELGGSSLSLSVFSLIAEDNAKLRSWLVVILGCFS